MLHLQLTDATIRCKFIKVNEDYTWIGADGRRLAMFEGVFDVPEGISFNSYLLKDDKTVLFDTADSAVARQFRENLLHDLVAHTLKNRTCMMIENGSWAPAAARGMSKILEPLNWRLLDDAITIKSALREDQLVQLERMADTLAQDIKSAASIASSAAGGGAKKQFVCKICGYVHEAEELPADFKCPLCGAAAEYFKEK